LNEILIISTILLFCCTTTKNLTNLTCGFDSVIIQVVSQPKVRGGDRLIPVWSMYRKTPCWRRF